MKQLITLLLVLYPLSGLAQEQNTWNVSLWGERRAFTEHVEKLAELVAQKTDGEFQLNLSYGNLSRPQDNLNGVANGAFEMAQICTAFNVEDTPTLGVLELPYLGVSTLSEERFIGQYLLRHPAVLRDLQRFNAIALMPTPVPQQNLVGTGASPNTPADLAGMTIRANAGTAQAMEAIGAFPTLLAATEVRDALGTNRINAAAYAPHEHMSLGTIANATWWTENLNPGTVNCPIVANISAIEKLSPQHQDALYSSINESLDYYVQNYEYNLSQSWEPVLRELNIEKVYFSENDLNTFRHRAAATAAISWIQENTARGIDAQSLYESVIIALYNEKAIDIPDELPVQTEEDRRQQILDNYSFNRVPGEVGTPLPQVQQERTFSFNRKPAEQIEQYPVIPDTIQQELEELPVAQTFPIEVPQQNTKVENISDVTVAALPAGTSGHMFFNGRADQRPVPKATTAAKAQTAPIASTAQVSTVKSNTRIENIADVTLAALPATVEGSMFFSNRSASTRSSREQAPQAEKPLPELASIPAAPASAATSGAAENYFGPPRNGTAKTLTANPMEMTVAWDLDSNTTVGETLQQLAHYIGYSLENDISPTVLNRKLPTVQRKVESITVANGFKAVSGKGLLTVFNHVDRTVKHLQQKTNTTEKLSVCPDDITLASFSREGVLMLADGTECLFQ